MIAPPQGLAPASPVILADEQWLDLPRDILRDEGASGSTQSTTGTTAAGSPTLTLAAAEDFANGQGISVVNAGAAPTIAAPASLSVTPTGTAGTTGYTYAVAALDGKGGITAVLSASTTTGNATLSATNYNALLAGAVAGAAGYAWWRTASAGSPATTGFLGVTYADTLNDTGLAVVTPPAGIPAAAPAAALGDLLVTTIKSISGTTVTMADNAVAAVAGATVNHDDTAAAQAGLNAGNSSVVAPGKTFLLSSGLTVPAGVDFSGVLGGTVLKFAVPNLAYDMVTLGGTGSSIENMTLNCNWTGLDQGAHHAVTANTQSGLLVSKVTCKNTSSSGVHFVIVTDSRILNVTTNSTKYCGVYVNQSTDIKIDGCIVKTSGQGILLDGGRGPTSTGITQANYRVSVTNNQIDTVTNAGIYFNGSSECTATGNRVTAATDIGIDFEWSWSCTATGNTVSGTTNDAMAMFGVNYNCTFEANTIVEPTGGNGIFIGGVDSASTGFSSEENAITGNTIKSPGQHGIEVQYNCFACVVSANTIIDAAYGGIVVYDSGVNELCHSHVVKGNTVHGCAGPGIFVNQAERCKVADNICYDNGSNPAVWAPFSGRAGGIVLTNANHAAGIVSDEAGITGNICWGNYGHGIGVDTADRLTLTGNTCTANNNHGISVASTNYSSIGGNVCARNGNTVGVTPGVANSAGIAVDKASYIAVNDNICIDDQGVPTQAYGILYDITAGTDSQIVQAGNITHGNTSAGVSYQGAAAQVTSALNYGATGSLQSNALGATYGTTTTANDVSAGAGVTLIATSTQAVLIGTVVGNNNTVGDGITVAVYRSTTSIPAQGAAPNAGDVVVWDDTYTQEGAASNNHTFAFNLVDTGLTVGTTYYYYVTLKAVTGGTASAIGSKNQTVITAQAA